MVLWNDIFTGRPVERDADARPYRSEFGDSCIAWWTADEAAVLHEAFEFAPTPVDVDALAMATAKRAIADAYDECSGLVVTVA